MKDKKPRDKKNSELERRKYIRLDAIFPVEFQFLDVATKKPIGEMKQGFTRDIGRGGICLEANNIGDAFKQALKEQKARLDLRMHIPLKASEKKAVAEISWCKEIKSDYPNKYLIGLSFLEISAKDRDSIYSHAKKISLLPKIVSIAVILLFFGVLYFYSVDFALKKENKRLVTQLVELSGKRSILEKDILVFDSERNELESELLENQDKLVEYKQRVKELKKSSLALKQKYELLEHFEQDKSEIESELKAAVSEKEDLTEKVANLSKEAQDLKNRISNLTSKRATAEGDLKTLLTSFEDVEDKNIKNMYKWIENHQNRLTGLVTSYEGDKKLEDWAFTYDQSLVAQVFTLMGDQEKARAIFDFYKHKAKKAKGSFVNAYDSYTGLVLEYSVHAGPNIWLGIAALQYTQKFKDKDYLPLAEDIAGWLIKLQNDDKEFGIKGGPDFTWFSTEHNLDAYAFFGMLYKITEEEKYLQAQERTLEWIKKNAFNKKQGRFNRGKGDATIATDTFAWAIAALGPELLKASNMDPDQIMDFAEENCLVTTYFIREDGEQVEITGFDFGKYEHTPRGGVVSTEWTAQMIVSFKIMAAYHNNRKGLQKADYYKRKADFHLSELEKMVVISPSRVGQGEGCLPYATHDDVDTGHGWRVASGTTTGSTAGTTYTIFAKYNYNPLMLQ